MSSCLGLYIEEHLIKYAKVSKEHENIKVETFGIKFYDKIDEAISQVIEETYSQKTPISINLSEEMYSYFEMFALLRKNDLQKAIKTEFESYCTDKGYNPNVFETRYAIVDNQLDKEKIKIIHIAENKIELNKRIQQIEGYKLVNISPISMAIPNLIHVNKNENCIIVNIENKTTVTTILDNKIFNIDVLDEGSMDILTKINLKENSYSKSYEICKNTTIYTSEGKELQDEETGYLEDIMPTLYTIVGKIKKMVNATTEKIDKVYITGTGALINNVDLYFQEYLTETNCEILKPSFVKQTKDISMKDYIEVNSAISIALMGLGEGISGMNFKKQTLADQVPDWLKIEINPDRTKKEQKNLGGFFTWDLNQELDKTEKSLLRVAVGLLLLVIIYSGFASLLNSQMNKKEEEAQASIAETNNQISLANQDNQKIQSKTNEYTTLIKNLEEANDKIADRNKTRNAIPNLLNQIMSVIPENVQLTSIENTSNTHIVIQAQSNKYEQLGYLKAKIKTDVILTNVISTAGQKDNNVVTVKIEGDLP
jgi:Tfp pilus assembly protein PilN